MTASGCRSERQFLVRAIGDRLAPTPRAIDSAEPLSFSWRRDTVVLRFWILAVDAAREVASVDEYGPAGQATAAQLSGESLTHLLTAYEEKALPLDLNAFNAMHHGGKVAQQDLELLRDHVAAGERQGKPMVALKLLIAELTAFRQQAA